MYFWRHAGRLQMSGLTQSITGRNGGLQTSNLTPSIIGLDGEL